MSAASVTVVAARNPKKVSHIVLAAPFLQDPDIGFFKKSMYKLALLKPWGPSMWVSTMKDSYITNKKYYHSSIY